MIIIHDDHYYVVAVLHSLVWADSKWIIMNNWEESDVAAFWVGLWITVGVCLSSTSMRQFINCLNYRLIDCTWLIIRIFSMPYPVFPCIQEEPFNILFCSCLINVFFFFLSSRSKTSQRLISHDIHSNTYNYKSTFSVEIVPVCKVDSSRLIISVGPEFHTALSCFFFFF